MKATNIRPEIRKKPVRSYVIRSGRMTDAQKTAYDHHWQTYGLTLVNSQLDFASEFGRDAPLVLEIGFGMGDSLIQMCVDNPESNFVGIEVHPPGVGRIMNNAAKHRLENLKVFLADAKDVLNESIADNSLSRIQIYFPDPWHKKKHNKRRLLQAEFLGQLAKKLKPEGLLHMATDWEPYAQQMLEVGTAEPLLENKSTGDGYVPRPFWRPETKFEKRGAKLGHGIWDLLFKKKS